MSHIDDVFSLHNEALFRFHGETVQYQAKGSSTWTSITALVDRDPPESLSGVELAAKPKVRITVRNDATYGILISSLNVSGDKIRYAQNQGGDVTVAAQRLEMPIHAKPVTQSGDMLVFEL